MSVRALLSIGLLLVVAASGCAEPLPPPRREDPSEDAPTRATPAKTTGKRPSGPKADSLEVKATKRGPRVRHTASGLSFLSPAEGELVAGGRRGELAFDGGYRLSEAAFEVRLRLTQVNRPGEARKVALRLCSAVAAARSKRKGVRVQVGMASQCRDWGADAAASAIYACPREALDMEETLVLVKGGQAMVVWKAFARSTITPALWTELNTRLNASLTWGGPGKPPAPTTSFYVDRWAELTETARGHAKSLATSLAAGKVKPADVLRAAEAVRGIAFGSDAPDAALGDRAIVREAVEAGLPKALRDVLETEFTQRVITHRDLRGLDPFLREVARRYPK